jgi:L,D-peptidoglycan transpeptidase YkuD (ErfK/YbiS/YcfS/YnhG family)
MVTYIHVRAINQSVRIARLSIGANTFPCWLGRTGLAFRKREGDGKTPIGVWILRPGYYRADRSRKPASSLKLAPLPASMGWCETPASGQYNRKVRLPFRDVSESMWRTDNAYDVVFPTGHNENPRVKGVGSAIFLHLLREGADCTAGCIAVTRPVMQKILARCGKEAALVVWPPTGAPSLNAVRRRAHSPP